MSSDLTKCVDGKCPSRKLCRHYVTPSQDNQSYADFNRHPDENKCQDFWLNTKEDKYAKHV